MTTIQTLKKMIKEPASKEWFEKYGNPQLKYKKEIYGLNAEETFKAEKGLKADDNDVYESMKESEEYENHDCKMSPDSGCEVCQKHFEETVK